MHVEVSNGQAPNQLSIKVPAKLGPEFEGEDQVHLGLSSLNLRETRRPSVWRIQTRRGRLRLPGRWRVRCSVQDGNVRLGPVIGIFSSKFLGRRRKPVAGAVGRFRRMITDARFMGAIAYVFAPPGIRWRERTIVGYTYLPASGGGRWVRGVFPFPNVVYNRVPSRRAEWRPSVKRARTRLEQVPGLHLFNPHFLNKWDVYQALQQSHVAQQYLPATAPLKTSQGLLDFLDEHQRVYIKLDGGSLGIGTSCVERRADGHIMWRSTRGKASIRSRVIRSRAALSRTVSDMSQRRNYLMQAAVPLLKTRGRPFDIRALVQKTTDEQWRVTGMAARIAGPGQITTHRPRGGRRARLQPIIRSVFQDENKAKAVSTKLRRAIEEAATAFDQASGGSHGELSLDVGLDQEGHPWILEINAKPMIFDEPSIRREARRRLLRYCFVKGGFHP